MPKDQTYCIRMQKHIEIIQDKVSFSPQQPHSLFRYLNTTYLICLQTVTSPSTIITLTHSSGSHLCYFQKWVNPQLGSKARTLLQHISPQKKTNREWVCLYSVPSLIPTIIKSYISSDLSYGQQILVQSPFFSSAQNPLFTPKTVSNCFSQNGDFFYFLENELPQPQLQFGYIFNTNKKLLYGVCLTLNEKHLLCLSFATIVLNEKTNFKVESSILPLLSKTVYIEVQGTHSTGTLINKDKILTVRHAFPSKQPLLGSEVHVKIYPYRYTYKAILVTEPNPLFDAIVLHLVRPQEFLQVNEINAEQPLKFQECPSEYQSPRVGQKIRALGFGKYYYNLHNFQKVDLLLPTLMTGVVSKSLKVGGKAVMFKTDAYLYNGFSGCSIWSEEFQLGMAVFCIKNVSTYNQLYRQNFSYLLSWIGEWLKSSLGEQQQEFMRRVDQFTHRRLMQVRSRL